MLFGKGMNQAIFPLSMDNQEGRLGSLILAG